MARPRGARQPRARILGDSMKYIGMMPEGIGGKNGC